MIRRSLFHGAWVAVTSVYHSGYKPADLEKLALEKYEANNGHPFQHLTLWAKLKAEGKWLSCYNKMNGNEEKSPSVGTNLETNAVNLEGEERPLVVIQLRLNVQAKARQVALRNLEKD